MWFKKKKKKVRAATELPGGPYSANVNQEVLEELPHVVGGVDLLHLNLSVHVTVVQEVDISYLHLKRLGLGSNTKKSTRGRICGG